MAVSLGGQLEAETLAYWCHISAPADNADLLEFLVVQLREAKAEQAEKRGRHDVDPDLAQDIADLTELCGVIIQAWNRQKRAPVDPHGWKSLGWQQHQQWGTREDRDREQK